MSSRKTSPARLRSGTTALLSGVLFALYLPSANGAETPHSDNQPGEEQIAQAERIMQSNPACKNTFSTAADSDVTLNDFELAYSDDVTPLHLVNIWAIWCAPCRAEVPVLAQLNEKVPATIDILNLGDNPAAISKFAEKMNIAASLINRPAPENILQTVKAQGLPYNAVFYGERLIGTRNKAIHDDGQLSDCLTALGTAETGGIANFPQNAYRVTK